MIGTRESVWLPRRPGPFADAAYSDSSARLQPQRCSCPAPPRKGCNRHVGSKHQSPDRLLWLPLAYLTGFTGYSDLESLGYILLSFLAPLPWAQLARQMDVQYVRDGCRMTPIVQDLLRRIELSKEGYLRSVQARRGGDMRRGEEAVSEHDSRARSVV